MAAVGRRRWGAAVLALALSLSGCGGSDGTVDASSGQTVDVAEAQDASTEEPLDQATNPPADQPTVVADPTPTPAVEPTPPSAADDVTDGSATPASFPAIVLASSTGGQIDFGSLEGQDTVLWFWAPW